MDDIGDLMTADDVRLLAELGYTAISRGFDAQAEALFRGVCAARPGGEAGPIGRALVLLHRGDPDGAVALLRPLPPSDPVRLFLGMALARRGDAAEARAVLADLAAAGDAVPEAGAARAIVAELRREISSPRSS